MKTPCEGVEKSSEQPVSMQGGKRCLQPVSALREAFCFTVTASLTKKLGSHTVITATLTQKWAVALYDPGEWLQHSCDSGHKA